VDSNVSAWTLGGSIFTFAPLYLLFIAVAAALYVVYTKPGVFPGHKAGSVEHPAIQTAVPGKPLPAAKTGQTASGSQPGNGAAASKAKDEAGE
jgi:hypothetical protein